jgi:putative ABC transport system substrate-binding protein
MKRREFISLLGGAAAWPLAARAQQAMPVIGFLHSGSLEVNAQRVAAFRKGLRDTGYVEGQNVAIKFRWAAGQDARLPEMAADLVRRRVAVIATPVSTQATLAAKAATTTIPIVFAVGGDPVAMGLVASLNRPAGNATGISILNVELNAKRLGLLRELAPRATRYAALVDRSSAMTDAVIRNLEASAPALGLKVEILYAGTDHEIDAAFANLSQAPGAALLVISSEFLFIRRAQIVTLAARHALPAIYQTREYADIGGLMSYAPDIVNACELVGIYAGRLLKGEKPADLPVAQSTKFEMVINLTTAKALGISVPPTLLALADEVIE